MPKSDPNITAAELRVMKVVWRLGVATVRDVKDQISAEGEDQPAYTTIMTLMNQLASKGVLRADRDRQPFVYHPIVRREQVLGERLKQFLHTVFDGQAGELVLRLVQEAELSPEDLRRIEAHIEARERDETKRESNPSKPKGQRS